MGSQNGFDNHSHISGQHGRGVHSGNGCWRSAAAQNFFPLSLQLFNVPCFSAPNSALQFLSQRFCSSVFLCSQCSTLSKCCQHFKSVRRVSMIWLLLTLRSCSAPFTHGLLGESLALPAHRTKILQHSLCRDDFLSKADPIVSI